MPIPRTLTVQIDSREKYPLVFPQYINLPAEISSAKTKRIKIKTEKIKLDTGDYCLKEAPECCIIERKASITELFKNMCDGKDSRRQAKSLQKLSNKAEHPVVVIEGSPRQLLSNKGWHSSIEINPELILARLFKSCTLRDIQVQFVPNTQSLSGRRKLGHILLVMMASLAYY